MLGSTGSIGTSTLKVLSRHPGRFHVAALTAFGQKDLLEQQVRAWAPGFVGLVSEGANGWASGAECLVEAATRPDAEVVVNGIVGAAGLDTLTGEITTFRGMPAGTRAVQLPDAQYESHFLGLFGRPEAATACECERSSGASLAQAVHMLNSPEILTRVGGAMAKRMNADPRPHRERLTELYLRALSRPPTAHELTLLEQRLSRVGSSGGGATGGAVGGMDYSDVLWVLINSREFLFNR